MSDHPLPKAPTALLISVGGSPNPVLHSINHHRPDHVWFFCSRDTIEQARKIYADVLRDAGSWSPTPEFFVIERFEELGPCYSTLRSKIPTLLEKWSIQPQNVFVDYTGGTKTMSAALVLAAAELFEHFSYIGGEQRDKGGIGITLDGKERVFYQQNPWASLAIREVERARDSWAHFHFDAAGDVLSKAAPRLPQPLLYETIADVARGLAARHRLDFKEAKTLLGKASKALPMLFDGKEDHGLTDFVFASVKVCEQCKSDHASNTILLQELLDNTLRTAAQHRFEDAAARLYRCMEMQLQFWLCEKTDGLFKNGRCNAVPGVWPAHLSALEKLQPDEFGQIKLGLERIIRTLHDLGDHRVSQTIQDLDSPTSELRSAAQSRNKGILAHGTTTVGSEGFQSLKTAASKFFPFNLAEEHNGIPPLDPRWLQLLPG